MNEVNNNKAIQLSEYSDSMLKHELIDSPRSVSEARISM